LVVVGDRNVEINELYTVHASNFYRTHICAHSKELNMQARKVVAFDDILRIFEYYNFLQMFLEVIRLL